MHMPVDHPGQDKRSIQLEDLGLPPHIGHGFGVRGQDGLDDVPPDHQGAGPRRGGVHGEDVAAEQHKVCGGRLFLKDTDKNHNQSQDA